MKQQRFDQYKILLSNYGWFMFGMICLPLFFPIQFNGTRKSSFFLQCDLFLVQYTISPFCNEDLQVPLILLLVCEDGLDYVQESGLMALPHCT